MKENKNTKQKNENVSLLQITKAGAYRDANIWADEFINTVEVPNLIDDIKASDEIYTKAKQFCFDLVIKIFDVDNYITNNPELLQLHEEIGKKPRIVFSETFKVYMIWATDSKFRRIEKLMRLHVFNKQKEMSYVFHNRLQMWFKEGVKPNDSWLYNIFSTPWSISSDSLCIYRMLDELSDLFNHLLEQIVSCYKHKIAREKIELLGVKIDVIGKSRNEKLKDYGIDDGYIDFENIRSSVVYKGYSRPLHILSKHEAYDGSTSWAHKAEEIILATRDDGEDFQTIAMTYCQSMVMSMFELDDWVLMFNMPYIIFDDSINVFRVHDAVNWILLDFSDMENTNQNANAEFFGIAQEVQNIMAEQLFNRLKFWLDGSSQNDKTINFHIDHSPSNNLIIINKALSEMTEFFNYLYNNHFVSNHQGTSLKC
jgi:hypothetical protein